MYLWTWGQAWYRHKLVLLDRNGQYLELRRLGSGLLFPTIHTLNLALPPWGSHLVSGHLAPSIMQVSFVIFSLLPEYSCLQTLQLVYH